MKKFSIFRPKNSAEKFLGFNPVEAFDKRYAADIDAKKFFGLPIEPILDAEDRLLSSSIPSVGYFSMEYGLSANTYHPFAGERPTSQENWSPEHHVFSNLRAMDYYLSLRTKLRLDLPIYSGGLGVLAGDTLKSVADRGVSLGAVGILWHKGYFKQNFWFKDGQIPEENTWDPFSYPGLVPLKTRIQIRLRKETIHLRLWKYFVYSFDQKNVVPLVLLDSNIDENSSRVQQLTGQLYRSDNVETKILQRVILGIGGMKAFEALGYHLDRCHLNEGHAALAFLEKPDKNLFAYTCHTPVAAGHDRFTKKSLQDILPDDEWNLLKKSGQDSVYPDQINLTELAMNNSAFVNAVAQKHATVTRLQFPQHASRIEAITNGVHTHTWVSDPMAELFDKYDRRLGGWRKNPKLLKNALSLKDNADFRTDVWNAHQANKETFSRFLKNWKIEPDCFTLCWARRIAGYKRPSLIFQDTSKLLDIARRIGPLQILFAGKAHPKDDLGFTHVNEILSAIDSLEPHRHHIRVAMLENYDTFFGKLLTSGVDVWLNNPLPPFEASGTSGMKAILNGVLQLSTLDGWVVEAAEKNIGWIFGWRHEGQEIGDERNLRLKEDAGDLYHILEKVVSLYYQTHRPGHVDPASDWITKMIHAIAEAGTFNTDRMVEEYQTKIWKI